MTDLIWNTISEIIPNRLYLTGLKGMENVELVKSLNVDIIVSVTDFIPFKYGKPKRYLNINFINYYAEDKPEFDIKPYFTQFIELMNSNLNKIILVHCLIGASRSATIVGSYLLYKKIVKENKKDYTVSQMLSDMKDCREWVDPNNGFMNQLEEFRSELL